MLICSARLGFASAAADVAVLLTERGLGGIDPDLELRWRRWRRDRSKRSKSAQKLASNWCRLLRRVPRSSDESARSWKGGRPCLSRMTLETAQFQGERWQSVGGRGFRLDPALALSGSLWLAVAEVAGRASGARILSAAPIDEGDVLDLFSEKIENRTDASFDPIANLVAPRRTRRLGNIILSSGPDPSPDQRAIERALVEGVRDHGLSLLPWNERALQLRLASPVCS